ncbi:MAG: replicative DNA helicase [Tepidisphaeraceae bacterium]
MSTLPISDVLDTQFERLPPHSIDAEMCCIASVMLDPEMAANVLPMIDGDAFYLADHKIIFDTIKQLHSEGKPVDAIILRDELKRCGKLDEIGGTHYIGEILNKVPSAAHGVEYAERVREKAVLRQLITVSSGLIQKAYTQQGKADDLLDQAAGDMFKLAEKRISNPIEHLGVIASDVYEMIEEKSRKGVETGFFELDDMLNGLSPGEMIIVAARPSMGKAQPLDANVLTTAGFKRMGDLRIGDDLASIDGERSTITGIYPQGVRQVYRITFADGRSTECCAEHLWRIHFRQWPEPKVLSTAKLMELLQRQRYQGRLSIETFHGGFGTDAHLNVDPWLLGLLLGDGSLSGTSLRFATADRQVLARVADAIGSDMTVTHAGAYDYRIVRREKSSGVSVRLATNPIRSSLRALGLWDIDATAKFIPASYLNATRETRLRLLAGLLDADGWVEKWGSVRLATSSLRLAKDVVSLVRSLGGCASFFPKRPSYSYQGERRAGQLSYVCNLQLPADTRLELLDAKAQRIAPRERRRRLNVVSIVPTRTVETQCISVSHPSRLYVTDEFIVTHNTAFSMNVVENMAANMNSVAVFSLEMSKQQLAQRLMCSRSGVDQQRVRKGTLTNEEYQRLARTVVELKKMPVFVDDSPQLTVLDLRTKCRRLKHDHDIKAVMIDYMQLMDNPGPDSRQQQISEISRGIKAVAREIGVPVIALSQLNRASESREGHKPRMSDLRESGSIEQDADVIMLLHREDYYHQGDAAYVPTSTAEVIVAKQRNGPTGTVELVFDGRCAAFRNKAPGGDIL